MFNVAATAPGIASDPLYHTYSASSISSGICVSVNANSLPLTADNILAVFALNDVSALNVGSPNATSSTSIVFKSKVFKHTVSTYAKKPAPHKYSPTLTDTNSYSISQSLTVSIILSLLGQDVF